ncbi:ABC transporter substrate-binding protein [Niameybacter massiliensis]|uniref:ABC transporter substrate-binding protein n=1 Tax=Holtiella tumoricola TaxID=3018743 RepID=A0AA42DJQ9_9FIRM|nr:ABC transporter substrate-binding protein [Holtiella tumoricola]MDA3729928.1 ABC transporter substrate-binding protein [Holtiella tumoricola]
MKMKKAIAFLITTLLISSMGVGCSQQTASSGTSDNQTSTTTQTNTESAKTPKETTKEKKEVVIWDYFETDAQKAMMQTLIDGFNSSQDAFTASHVYVPFADYEKQLTLGIASGELPDIVILDGCGMASFISLGLFADITDEASDIKWDEYIQGPLESTMMDGKHYGIPFATNCTALFYNKDMFDEAGLSYPDENTTWDEFKGMAKTLTKNGVFGFGNAGTNTDEGTFQCLQWLYTAGGSYTDIESGVDAYKLMQEMISDGSWTKECVNWTQSDVNNNFMAGNLAMQQNGPWQIPGIEANAPDLNYGVTVLPKKDASSGQATSILGGENMGVVNKDDVGGAVAFLEYYDQTNVMVEAMKQYGSFPPKTEAAKDGYWTNDPVQAAFITQLETSIPRGPSAVWPSYSSAIQKGFQEVLTLSKTPEQAAKDTQAAVDAVK